MVVNFCEVVIFWVYSYRLTPFTKDRALTILQRVLDGSQIKLETFRFVSFS
jgi:hypothetical protein